MKRLLAACVVGIGFLAGAAQAGTIENSFGHTLRVTQPDGAVINYHFEADGTFMAHAGEQAIAGGWRNEGEQVCLTPQGQSEQCYPAGDYGIGDTWTLDGEGGAASLTIVAGR